ncbi:MAG: DUF488 domain-containing protein [Sedimentisphaerales bacterium]|nr:DUF488 domain-containing protein [Sedimentisphaerales bacterium]
MTEMYTIGHSNHTIEHFIRLLVTHGISAVADVRSRPYSEYSPQFNRELLQQRLQDANIEYVFLGRELGARRTEDECYVNGQAAYGSVRNLPVFRDGLSKILEGVERCKAALMCAEADPLACHRTILICPALKALRPDMRIKHILADGGLESHEEAEQRLVRLHKLQPELFGELTSVSGLVQRAYDMQAARVAYKTVPAEA